MAVLDDQQAHKVDEAGVPWVRKRQELLQGLHGQDRRLVVAEQAVAKVFPV